MAAASLSHKVSVLSQTINAYVYRQYADDDDVQALNTAYNQATQTYLTWFNTVDLPFYPGLTGELLDWVAEGLYGLKRTSLAYPVTALAVGPLNSAPLNTIPLNYFDSIQTIYTLSDDVFKRILTWNFFKGDGKRFCMRWLKRRIMRFLVGTNGIDPRPWVPGFVVGAENTTPIGVVVSSGTLTVTISQSQLSSLVQIQPNVLPLFEAAFLGGILELPAQYTYAVDLTG